MIEVSHLTKMYGPHKAVSDLNFSISAGEIVGFLGPNGAGKTTTMKILTGFMPASQGTAKVAGFDVFDEPLDVKRNVGYLPETPPVYFDMKVSDYVSYAAKLHEVPKDQLKSATDAALEKAGLTHVSSRLVGNLSKGYRQRVGLAQALVHNPKVLILDEPTVGLDPGQIIEIRDLIKGLAGEHTVILSTHILPEVTATCQRVIIISRGKIVAQDTIANLLSRSSYVMSVRTATDAGTQAIRKIPGVAAVTAKGSQVFIELKPEAPEVRDQIVKAGVDHGMGVLEFASQQESLEQVFIRLTSE